jgi:dihydrolipoamide dehydrogenase
MVVIGAGASGSEIASAYQRLGTKVTLYEVLDRILSTEDADTSKAALRSFKKQGIEVRTSTFYDGQEADWVVIATGRTPDVDPLGIEAAGSSSPTRG